MEIATTLHHTGIDAAMQFLGEALRYRLSAELQQTTHNIPDDTAFSATKIGQWCKIQDLSQSETLVLILALAPMVAPNFLNDIISEFLPNGGEFPEFGGIKGKNHRGIIPTGETALYLLAGNDLDLRTQMMSIFDEEGKLNKQGIVGLNGSPQGEPPLSGVLSIDAEHALELVSGNKQIPKQSAEFPAERISTSLEWEDLILSTKTMDQVKEIQTWLKYNDQLMEMHGLKHRIKPGYRVMFHGPPGTGKTLTATLLGKYTNKDVYRIDLSMVVSKYIGETEKNLSKLFNKAMHKDWILFFDEADSIFGKRTNVRDAHDKYANQEVAYLLQRIEAHPGLVVLATNLKSNIDSAFTRRFQSIVAFESPSPKERMQLWEMNLPKKLPLHPEVDLLGLAKTYEITGSNIVNIIQHSCLQTLEKENTHIRLQDLIDAIKKEYIKEGKMI
ncbi:ATP-binding protein [Sungkyunkwania multivorans]|uniref:ATP-binding protein n=1 Tax=Sungkyunkwania multivorans TaxID=1173618 RepID=A0ABW3CXX0_9FLAO